MTRDIPPAKAALLDSVARALTAVSNMAAVALGGSHARGTHTPDSDLDIGLFYREAAPFDIEDIRAIARAFASKGEPTVTGFYDWGPFVNGGAWIEHAVCKIDFLYRNLDQLDRGVSEAEAGTWSHSYDQQPPFGFRSVTTLGEIDCCKPLFDPAGEVAALKARVATYPPRLKQRIVQDTLWCAEFTFVQADNFARSGDVPNTAGCMTRIYHYLVQALYALNETYFINDKRDLDEIARFSRCPKDFGQRASAILAHPGHAPEALDRSLRKLQMLFLETVSLAEGAYQPRFSRRN
ncbi:MAG: nucleotidyltransferase domain-containing protein [Rhizomicrobium sp.]|jgi:predicted nucleotidyltransferase